MIITQFQGWVRRNSITISFVIMICTFLSILYLQSIATSKLQSQIVVQKQIISQIRGIANQLKESDVKHGAEISEVNRHLDCIVNFFSQPDRTTKTIQAIDSCTVKNRVQ